MVLSSVSKLNYLNSSFSKHQQQKETKATLPQVKAVEMEERNSAAESF